MSKELILEEILQSGSKLLGKLSGATEIRVGRDPGEGIKIENTAISREHGSFLRIRNHWFYKDLGSTNGSWRNGQHIKQGQTVLVRPGDVLQFADTPVRIVPAATEYKSASYGGFPGFSSSTLIVFSGETFHDEFPLPEYGRALVVGGNQADLRMSNDVNELPRLVVERRGDKVCAYGIAEGPPITLNGNAVSETVALNDGDELQIAQYRILFNDPRSEVGMATAAAAPADSQSMYAGSAGQGGVPSAGMGSLREWEPANQAAKQESSQITSTGRFTFGKPAGSEEEDVEGTLAIDPTEMEARLAGYDMHPSSRYVGGEPSSGGALHSMEDRLIVLIGFVLLLVLVGLVVWWVFF